MKRLWNELWFRPAHPLGLWIAHRISVALALWICFSSPGLTSVLRWPDVFLQIIPDSFRFRFFLVLPYGVERLLWWSLPVCLVMSLLPRGGRIFAVVSGLLLYHFAPMRELITLSPWTGFGGWTVPLLTLIIIGCAGRPPASGSPSSDYRWPLVLVQLLFSMNYFGAALAKLHFTGWSWVSGENIRAIILGFHMSGVYSPWAIRVASNSLACSVIAWGTIGFELLFPLALFRRRLALAFAALAAIAHVGIVLTMGVFFHSAVYLLLFLDWDGIAARWMRGYNRRTDD